MILNSTLKSIQVVLGEAITTSNCDVTTSWVDTQSGTTFLPSSSDTVTNGVTPVTAVAAPGATVQRQVKEVRVFNRDTVPHDMFVILNDNGTLRYFDSALNVEPGGFLAYSPDAIPGAAGTPGADGAVLTATVTLSSANILALDSVPQTIVPAPGAGKFLSVASWMVSLDFGSVAYAGGGATSVLAYGTSLGAGSSITPRLDSLVDAAASAAFFGPSNLGTTAALPAASLMNQGIVLNSPTPFTTGNGTLVVNVAYSIMNQ